MTKKIETKHAEDKNQYDCVSTLKSWLKVIGCPEQKKKKKDMHVTKIPQNLKIKRKEKEKRETLEHIIDFF